MKVSVNQNINVVPFRAEHLGLMEIRPEICKAELEWMEKNHVALLYERFPSLTIMDGPRIVACFGGVYLWPNTAESWLRTAPDIRRYTGILCEQINRLTDFCFDIWNLNRVQTTVRKDWVGACKFVEHLGYIQEGELRRYIGNNTYIMYSKLLREN